MDEDQRAARRKALADQIARMKEQGGPSSVAPQALADEEDDEDELDWDADPGESASAASESDADLDSGWDDEAEQEAIEKAEKELPDEQFDPEAYALAKKALEERKAARREKKRAKDAEKKARRQARALQAKNKQKTKAKKARIVDTAKPAAKPKRARVAKPDALAATETTSDESAGSDAPAPLTKPRISRSNLLMLAAVVVIFLGALAFALSHPR